MSAAKPVVDGTSTHPSPTSDPLESILFKAIYGDLAEHSPAEHEKNFCKELADKIRTHHKQELSRLLEENLEKILSKLWDEASEYWSDEDTAGPLPEIIAIDKAKAELKKELGINDE